MNRQTFAWENDPKQVRHSELWGEFFLVVGLLSAALVLYCANLGSLPLRDWDEAIVAQVAKEIWQQASQSLSWLYPTLWGEPYLNKPPLVHALIAGFYALGGVNEWTARLPGALLSACSVPLLYCVGREIFPVRTPALFSALIYLTLLPVVRHGRLAMLDGALVFFSLLTMLCVLRSRRDYCWSLIAGLGWSAICLSKGIVAFIVAAIALVFLYWDTPRLLTCGYFWIGSILGSMPAIAWYAAQWFHYHETFVSIGLIQQSWQRVYVALDGHAGPFWYYLWEIFKYSWPWLLFFVWGIELAWTNRNWGWAKLVLVWAFVYLIVVSIMKTKLPWYILPIYPALSLAGGAQLAEAINLPSPVSYPRTWIKILGLLAIVAGIGSIYFAGIGHRDYFLALILLLMSLTLGMTAILLQRQDRQFLSILFWGMYLSMLFFICSPHWNWELNEDYPVKVQAAIIKNKTPPATIVYTSFDRERPSLNFYSDHRVIPASNQQLIEYWQELSSPYFLLDLDTWKLLNLDSVQLVDTAPNLVLITKKFDK
jgi:4-amino-4-deoxy-L-arabinose transferase-like glycosyltransferase